MGEALCSCYFLRGDSMVPVWKLPTWLFVMTKRGGSCNDGCVFRFGVCGSILKVLVKMWFFVRTVPGNCQIFCCGKLLLVQIMLKLLFSLWFIIWLSSELHQVCKADATPRLIVEHRFHSLNNCIGLHSGPIWNADEFWITCNVHKSLAASAIKLWLKQLLDFILTFPYSNHILISHIPSPLTNTL